MLRISLIIAVLAGVAALAVSQLKVAKTLEELRTDLKTTQDNLAASQAAADKSKKEAREALAAADKAKKDLETARNDLAAASEKADQQEKRANDLAARLELSTLDQAVHFGLDLEIGDRCQNLGVHLPEIAIAVDAVHAGHARHAHAVEEEGSRIVALLRFASPTPSSVQNYVFG